MTVREELHELVEVLDDGRAREALDYLHRLVATEEARSVEERYAGSWEETEDEGVEYLRRGGPLSEDDSLWNIVGIGRSDEPTDVAAFKDEYLAEAFAAQRPVTDRPEFPPPRVFVDTSAFFALANERDAYHRQAVAVVDAFRQRNARLFTTNFILAETHAMLLSKLGSRTAVRTLAEIDQSEVSVVRVSAGDERQARILLVQYDDKEFSLTDAMSFVVMERLRLRWAFTFDRHFAQYGFQIVEPRE